MAPNRKQLTLLSDSYLDLEVIQPKDSILAASQSQQQRQAEEEEERASYWDWPSSTPEDKPELNLFSADHIVANILRDTQEQTNRPPVESTTCSSSDAYWAEEDQQQQKQRSSVPLHLEQREQSDAYWNTTEPHKAAKDDYWNMSSTTNHQPVGLQARDQCHYWDESRRTANDDDYWAESTNRMEPSSQQSQSYWDWNPASQWTESDKYWFMPPAISSS